MKKTMLIAVLLATRLLGANAAVDPNFYIYICFGQSNMEGNAQPQSVDKAAAGIDKRFQLLATCNFSSPSRTKGNWYNAAPPLVSPNGGLGPTDYFGRTMVAAMPPEVRIGVIPVAMGGSPIEMFDKDKYQKKMADNPSEWWTTLAKNHYGGNPYGRIIEMAKKAQQVGVIKGILLHQGCSNNGDPNWPTMVKKIYIDMLKDLGLGADSVPLFVGETLRQENGGSCYGHNTQVNRMPSVVPTSHVVSSEGCPGNGSDPWHFNALGYRIIGKRYAIEALKDMGREVKPDGKYQMADVLKKFYGAKSLSVNVGEVFVPGEAIAVTATFNDGHTENVSDYVTFRSNDVLIQDGKIVGEGDATVEVLYDDFSGQQTTTSFTTHISYFPFTADYFKKRQGTATVDVANRTVQFLGTNAQAGWQYGSTIDFSAFKYLVVKLKEAQTGDIEIRLSKKVGSTISVGYKETIGDRMIIAIDLNNMIYNKVKMAPSTVYKVLFHSPQTGSIAIDDIFLSNDDQYAVYTTGVRPVVNTSGPFVPPLYSLDGRLVQTEPLKGGVYISEGQKKVIRK